MTTRKIVTKYKWKIDKISQQSSIVENGGSIVSDVFSLKGNCKAKFLIKIERYERFTGEYSKRHNPKYTTAVKMSLICEDFGRKNKMDLNVKIWHENTVGVIKEEPEVKLSLNRDSTTGDLSSTDVLYLNYHPWYMKSYIIDDILFICCEIQHEEPANKFYEDDSEDEKEELAARNEFGQKLFALHSEEQFDLKIQVGGKEFKASKLNLMACSEVFHRMLACPNSIEAKTGVIQIENTKPEIIDALLRWVYQVEVKNMEEIVMELYQVADKYAIALLKKKCIKLMIKGLSNENAASYLMLAYKHDEELLKEYALNFIREDYKNLESLMTYDEWLKLSGEDPDEVKKIVADIFQ